MHRIHVKLFYTFDSRVKDQLSDPLDPGLHAWHLRESHSMPMWLPLAVLHAIRLIAVLLGLYAHRLITVFLGLYAASSP